MELVETELFLHLTVCKQKNYTHAKLNCFKFSETIYCE